MVFSERMVIVVTSLALMVVSVMVKATDHGSSSATLNISELGGEDVMKLSSLLMLIFSSSAPIVAVQ